MNQKSVSLLACYRIICVLALFGFHDLHASELNARDVMERVDTREDGDTLVASYSLILIDRRDRQRNRELMVYSKDFGADSRRLTRIQSPADITGTAYLNYDWADPERDDDSWLYLPALQRVKRLASSETSDSFLGSDFTYADINGLEIDWYDYEFVEQSEIVDGHDCWVIEALPKPDEQDRAEQATGYSRMRVWIRKDNFVQVQAQAWELRGNRIKYFSAGEIERVEGIWTVGRRQAVTTRNGRQEHASLLQLIKVTYNEPLEDSVFATDSMQRGLD